MKKPSCKIIIRIKVKDKLPVLSKMQLLSPGTSISISLEDKGIFGRDNGNFYQHYIHT